jgi:hypothetical protein
MACLPPSLAPEDPAPQRRARLEPAADQLSPAQMQALAILVGDPDELEVLLVEHAGRKAACEHSLGRLLGDAIADVVFRSGGK